MTAQKKNIVHGSAVSIQIPGFKPAAVLLRGFSGRGKSDLAFRLIAAGAILIGDDQVSLEHRQDKIIMAEAVPAIQGLLEVRGIGLVKYPVVTQPIPLRLVVDLVPREDVPRLPEKDETVDIIGVPITFLKLHAFDTSTPHKIFKAIELVHKPDLLV